MQAASVVYHHLPRRSCHGPPAKALGATVNEKEPNMRWTFVTAALAIAGVGVLTFGTSPTEAAVFSVGPSIGSIGNTTCMDVSGNDPNPGAEVLYARQRLNRP